MNISLENIISDYNNRADFIKTTPLEKNENLSENDIKHLILEHYTFLSRPVIVYEDDIFIGNSSKTIAQMLEQVNAK
jgi:arsenate reductase